MLLSANQNRFSNQGPEIRQKLSVTLCHLHIFYLMVIHLLRLHMFRRFCSLYKKCLSALLIAICSFYVKKKKVLFPALLVIKAILFHVPRCSSKVNLSIQFNQEVAVLWYPWDMQNEKVVDPECLENGFSTY